MSTSGSPSDEKPSLLKPVALFVAAAVAFAWVQSVWGMPWSWTWSPVGIAVGIPCGILLGRWLESFERPRPKRPRRRTWTIVLVLEAALVAYLYSELRLVPRPTGNAMFEVFSSAWVTLLLTTIPTVAVLKHRAQSS